MEQTQTDRNNSAYYEGELKKVFSTGKTNYSPTIKIFANGNGENTKHMNLNKHSATVLMAWLYNNFINTKN